MTAGFGVTRALSYQVGAQVTRGELVVLLKGFEPSLIPVHLVYVGGRPVNARVRAFVDLVAERLASEAGREGLIVGP